MIRGDLLDLLHDPVLEVDVLEDGLDDEVGLGEVLLPGFGVVGEGDDVGGVLVVFVHGHCLPLLFLLPVAVDVGFALGEALWGGGGGERRNED